MRVWGKARLIGLVTVLIGLGACEEEPFDGYQTEKQDDVGKEDTTEPYSTDDDISSEPSSDVPRESSSDVPSEPSSDAPRKDGVEFADTALEECVRQAAALGDAEIFPEDLLVLTHLECQDRQIERLDGLEHALSLTSLSLWENSISDLAPIAGLSDLEILQMGNNDIDDLAPIAQLSHLKKLGLSVNSISNLAPLAKLAGLEWLNLDANEITKIGPLTSLANLRWLTIERNVIVDPQAIKRLRKQGCEVYSRYQGSNDSTPAGAQHFLPTIVPSLRPAPAFHGARLGQLKIDVDQDNHAFTVYNAFGQKFPVIDQSAHSLQPVGNTLYYRGPLGPVAVGSKTEHGWKLCQGTYAHTCRVRVGVKTSHSLLHGQRRDPVVTMAIELINRAQSASHRIPLDAPVAAPDAKNTEMFPYVMASPNQLDAGSCLFMATTGAMEVLINQRAPRARISYRGDTDLSERFLMIASDFVPLAQMPYLITDLFYTFNFIGGALLDRDYPFAAGYLADGRNGPQISDSTNPDAYFSCDYSWFDQLPANWENTITNAPATERTTIFVVPEPTEKTKWEVALMSDEIVERIKYELRTKNAPVVVVYNHYLYWHANVIVGYDDTIETGGCPMVDSSLKHFAQKDATRYVDRIKAHLKKIGPCSERGVFYVRDSIYEGGEEEETYVYGGDEYFAKKYSRRIIELSYNWVKYLANHAYSIARR